MNVCCCVRCVGWSLSGACCDSDSDYESSDEPSIVRVRVWSWHNERMQSAVSSDLIVCRLGGFNLIFSFRLALARLSWPLAPTVLCSMRGAGRSACASLRQRPVTRSSSAVQCVRRHTGIQALRRCRCIRAAFAWSTRASPWSHSLMFPARARLSLAMTKHISCT